MRYATHENRTHDFILFQKAYSGNARVFSSTMTDMLISVTEHLF